jgi:hypothetical protein
LVIPLAHDIRWEHRLKSAFWWAKMMRTEHDPGAWPFQAMGQATRGSMSLSRSNIADPDEIRARFPRARSDMARAEMPQCGTLTHYEFTPDANAAARTRAAVRAALRHAAA